MQITKKEFYTIITLSGIFALRMSGIFMILPILTIYAASLTDANEHLIGTAIGIYGITQIIFQLPFGIISDKIGSKPIIIIGLFIFAFGSELAAITNNIWGLIIGRALQGSGAIGSILITLLLNSVREHHQNKAMAIIGITFGVTFSVSIILGPTIANILGLNGLFQIITVLSILAILLAIIAIPHSKNNITNNINIINDVNIISNNKKIFFCTNLMKLNFNIFCLHTVLILNFIVWPKIITDLGYALNMHSKLYSLIITISAFVVLPSVFWLKKITDINKILIICTNILCISELIMLINICNNWIFLFGMQIFFIAFNLIEATLPSLINKKSAPKHKNTTMSIYSIGQFIGIGFGGILGGFLLETYGIKLVLTFAFIIISTCSVINNLTK